MKRQQKIGVRGRLIAFGAAGALVLSITGAPAAWAAVHNGSLGCAGKYGWLISNTTGSGMNSNQNTPPGSQTTYNWSTSGVRDMVATNWPSQTPKQGGGTWQAYGSSTASGTPHCETYS